MTVHINGSKGKDLYYGGTKIKEAYYNGNKVYSSRPLYYCYKGMGTYVYSSELITNTGYHTFLSKSDGTKATNTSQLTLTSNINVYQIVSNGFYIGYNYLYLYSQEDDLYT